MESGCDRREYEKPGPSREVLAVGEIPDPVAGAGEVRIRVWRLRGIHPGDTTKRGDVFGLSMAFARIPPHSDGAGVIYAVNDGVSP